MTDTDEDRELARRLGRGDPRTVDAFYRTHLDAIYQFVFFRVGRSREDAEDVTADTFLTALRRIGEYEGRAPLASWLRGVARNKCRERNKMRSRRKIQAIVSLETTDPELLKDLATEDLPQRTLLSQEVATTVTAALSQIPEHYKRVLLNKYVDDMTFAEIAEKSDTSAKAVESLVQRAKTAFARMLKAMAGRADMRETRSFHG